MKIIVMGAGIIGICSAWYLLAQGHEVTVVERQPGAALETSFANGAQISVSFCEPWAHPSAPLKVAKWLLHDDAPLLFRPRLDVHQWRWCLAFLAQCTPRAFAANVAQLVALGLYSHEALRALVTETGIEYHRLERGILHFFSTADDFAAGAAGAALMRRHGVDRRVLSRDEVLAVEPALRAFGPHIAGGTYTASDESGDAHVFTQQLAQRCAARGARFLYGHEVSGFDVHGGTLHAVHVIDRATGTPQRLQGNAFVAALGSFTAPLLRPLGITLNLYPAKGYSATLPLHDPAAAATVSLLDDSRKIAISRLGNTVRIAGTAELAGYDTTLTSATAQARCAALVRRYEALFPGAADTSQPHFWAGLRPSTPDNLPLIGRTRIRNLWLNTGHGTLGWTHGAGSGRALAELISGRRPALAFRFLDGAVGATAAG